MARRPTRTISRTIIRGFRNCCRLRLRTTTSCDWSEKSGEPGVEVAVEDAEAAGDALLHRGLVDLHAAAAHVLLGDELAQELAAAAGEVEHSGAGRHQVLDQLVVDCHFSGSVRLWSIRSPGTPR